MQRKIWLAILVLAFVWAAIGFSEAVADDRKAGDFYKGAVLQFICPYAPGGGFDAWIRALAIPLQKHTGARVLVKNMPGSSGLIACSYLFNVAKPDGLTIGLIPAPGMTFGDMLQYEAFKLAKYEMIKFTHIARIELQKRALLTGSRFKTFEDMQQPGTTVHFTTTAPTSDAAAEAALVAEAFNLNAKIISGFKSSGEYWLAVMAGRGVDAGFVALRRMKGYVEKGELFPLAVVLKERMPDFPQVRTLLEIPGLQPDKRRFAELAILMHESGRAILAPPGVPEDRAAFLEQAIFASLKEPSVVEWAKKRGFSIDPLPGKELKKVIAKTLEIVPEAEREKFKHVISKKYY